MYASLLCILPVCKLWEFVMFHHHILFGYDSRQTMSSIHYGRHKKCSLWMICQHSARMIRRGYTINKNPKNRTTNFERADREQTRFKKLIKTTKINTPSFEMLIWIILYTLEIINEHFIRVEERAQHDGTLLMTVQWDCPGPKQKTAIEAPTKKNATIWKTIWFWLWYVKRTRRDENLNSFYNVTELPETIF